MILLTALLLAPSGLVIRGGTVYDGSGKPPVRRDIRVENGTIVAIGDISAKPGDEVIDAKGLAVAPGFIDAHSHGDGGIFDNRTADTQVRQGITT
ncbi:D-aminoacylase, partial [bacterium]